LLDCTPAALFPGSPRTFHLGHSLPIHFQFPAHHNNLWHRDRHRDCPCPLQYCRPPHCRSWFLQNCLSLRSGHRCSFSWLLAPVWSVLRLPAFPVGHVLLRPFPFQRPHRPCVWLPVVVSALWIPHFRKSTALPQ